MQLSINCRTDLRLEPQAPAVSRQAEFVTQTCSSVAMVRTYSTSSHVDVNVCRRRRIP